MTVRDKAMRFRAVQQTLARAGMVVRFSRELEEYAVRPWNGGLSSTYYTPDLADALETGLAMANSGPHVMKGNGEGI